MEQLGPTHPAARGAADSAAYEEAARAYQSGGAHLDAARCYGLAGDGAWSGMFEALQAERERSLQRDPPGPDAGQPEATGLTRGGVE